MLKILLFATVAISMTVIMGCGSGMDLNSNTRNSNVSRTPSPTATPTPSDADMTREEYERRKDEFEKDKGPSTIGQGIDDSWIWFKTRAALAAAEDLRDSTINVDVVNAKITLKGTVANTAQKERAGEIAKNIEGQKGVDNQVLIRKGDSITNQMVNGNTGGK